MDCQGLSARTLGSKSIRIALGMYRVSSLFILSEPIDILTYSIIPGRRRHPFGHRPQSQSPRGFRPDLFHALDIIVAKIDFRLQSKISFRHVVEGWAACFRSGRTTVATLAGLNRNDLSFQLSAFEYYNSFSICNT